MKKILLLLFCMIFLIGNVSALDIDDWKIYDEDLKTYSLENFFGLGKHITDLELKTPTVFKVPLGYGKVAEIEIRNGEYDYEEIINGIELYNIRKDMKEFVRNVDYKYKTFEEVSINDYKQICDELVNGTKVNCQEEKIGSHIGQREVWRDFTKNSLLKGEAITLGLFTEVKKGDKIEWILNVYGNERLTKWAIWEGGLFVGLVSYYEFEETSGAVVDSRGTNNGTNNGATRGVEGIIGNAFFFDGISDFVNVSDDNSLSFPTAFTFSLWAYPKDNDVSKFFLKGIGGGTREYGVDRMNDTAVRILLGDSGGNWDLIWASNNVPIPLNEWSHFVATWNGTLVSFYLNGTLVDTNNKSGSIINAGVTLSIGSNSQGIGDFFNGTIDEMGIWNRSLNATEINEDLWNDGNGCVFGSETCVAGVPIINLNSPIDTFNTTNQTINFNGTVTSPDGILNVTLFIDGILNETNSTGINDTDYIFTKVIADGNHNWTYESCNTLGCATATTRIFTVDTTNPAVIILAPPLIIDYHLVNTNLSVNWSANDTNIDTCILQFEGINKTVTCSDNSTEINITNTINRTIIFYVNDTLGNMNSTSRSWNYTIFENSQTFNDKVFEGNTETFTANITLGESYTISIASLFYNGTSTAGSFSQSGNYSILTIDIIIPPVNEDTNITFTWNLQLSDSQSINLTSYNQTITSISLDDCSVNTVVLYNYTIVDEGNQSLISNTTTELNLNILDIERTNYFANFSKLYSDINPFAVCLNININSSTYLVDSIVKYQSIGYSIEYYNIVGSTITNTTIPINITLYDLALADATEFRISFKGEDFVFVEDALIFIDRQYIFENNSFKTVELPKTDSRGQTVGHFVRNDVVYNIRVIKDGEVLGNFRNIIAFCTDFTIGDCQIVLEAVSSDQITFDYNEQLGIIFQSLPTYDNDTNTISFSFSTNDGTPKTVFMDVTRKDIFGNRTICNSTITSASGTLSCSIDPNIDDTVLETNIYVNNQLAVLSNLKLEDFDYGSFGYIIWFFLTFSFIWLFGSSKTELLIGMFISFAGAIVLGITRGDIVGRGSAGIWILVIIILGIWKINKENPQ